MKVDINAEIARILHQLPFYIIISFETQSYFDPDSFVSTYKYFNYEYYWHTGVLPWVLLMVTQILILSKPSAQPRFYNVSGLVPFLE